MRIDSGDALLRVESLCKYFKTGSGEFRAVDNISFEVKRGEVFGLVGESGCGKTTTGRSIIGIYDITAGNIYFKGQRISAGTRSYLDTIAAVKKESRSAVRALMRRGKSEPSVRQHIGGEIKRVRLDALEQIKNNREEIRRAVRDTREAKRTGVSTGMQMIFQDPIASLNPRMTVREIIAEGLIIKGVRDREYIDRQVYETLDRVGLLREHAGRYPHEFSGGQRQRIGIARAVIMRPDMIIADEPVSALDVSVQAQVINLLNDLKCELGLTVLFVAHDLSVVKYFSDRIGVMYRGKIVELADSDELFANPCHPYTRSLLSAIPIPDPVAERERQRIIYTPDTAEKSDTDSLKMHDIGYGHLVLCTEDEARKYSGGHA